MSDRRKPWWERHPWIETTILWTIVILIVVGIGWWFYQDMRRCPSYSNGTVVTCPSNTGWLFG